jgi:hypothetical protein
MVCRDVAGRREGAAWSISISKHSSPPSVARATSLC